MENKGFEIFLKNKLKADERKPKDKFVNIKIDRLDTKIKAKLYNYKNMQEFEELRKKHKGEKNEGYLIGKSLCAICIVEPAIRNMNFLDAMEVGSEYEAVELMFTETEVIEIGGRIINAMLKNNETSELAEGLED